ncbi:LmbU family transcriptional regulator [Catellatospora tritici]|uniref:LmbU family transcriptional regulator n=1 Tax=Catellatospora tritici TaxID=2851566 RepID=UPI001C2D15E6|nr:LmbU family transcriptional regulator [Catellatospora tritici]MBV1849560.1 LmbU family transcriptional regulator [Catellatospora tritici]
MRVERCGIVFHDDLSLMAWEGIGKRLLAYADSASWWIADWLAYGEARFQDRYEEAVKRTSLSYQTLRNYTWVARRLDMSRRRDSLSFGHHAEVAALEPPEQTYWLRKAEEHGWSRNQLRNEVRASRRERLADGATEARYEVSRPGDTSVGTRGRDLIADKLSLQLTSSELRRCEEAAMKRGLTVDRWATFVLLTAAERQ